MMRPGFEPDKSSEGWLGLRVRSLPGSGWIDGLAGTVIATEVRPTEFGWMKVRWDGPEGDKYPNGMLTHTTEVERIDAREK